MIHFFNSVNKRKLVLYSVVKQLITQLRQSAFLRHNAIFFTGSVAVGVLNYVYYPVIGRLLEPAAFGEVQVLVSLFLQLAIFLTVLGMMTVNIIATYTNRPAALRAVQELEKVALIISLAALAVVIFASEPLARAFKLDSGWPFIVLMLALVLSVPLSFRTAYLRGIKRFGQTSAVNITSAGSKLLLSVLFVLLGASTLGAIGGIVAAQLVALGYAVALARRAGFKPGGAYFSLPHLPSVLPELKYATLVFICSLGVILLFSADVIIVKYLFDAETAGLYAGVATVARIIFFLTASVAQVLLPMVSLKQPMSENQAVLYKSLALTFAAGLPVLIVCMLFPAWLTGFLMGSAYTALAHLLPGLALALFVLSVANLLVLYHMALRRWGTALVVMACVIITLVLMALRHATPEVIVNNLLIGSFILIFLISLWRLVLKMNSAKRHANT